MFFFTYSPVVSEYATSSSTRNALFLKSIIGQSETNGIFRMASQDGAQFYPLFKQELATDTKGNIYVADSAEGQIEVFSPDLKPLYSIGSIGSDLGQFQYLTGISIDKNNHIYAVDSFLGRIQIFDHQGTLMSTFGEKGSESGQLHTPVSTTFLDSKNLLIADFSNGVKLFSTEGEYQKKFSEDHRVFPAHSHQGPIAIDNDLNGNIYVLFVDYQERKSNIYSYNKEGIFQRKILKSGHQEHNLPDICIDFYIDYPYLFVSGVDDFRGAAVQRFKLSTQVQNRIEFVDTVASFPLVGREMRESEVIIPSGVAAGHNRIYYLDGVFNKIICMDEKKNVLHVYHAGIYLYDMKQEDFYHYLSNPQGITLDAEGNLLIVNSNYSDFVVLDQKGNLKNRVKIKALNQCASKPADIIIDDRGYIFISDMANHLVHVYDQHYNFIYSIDEGFSFPQGLSLNRSHELLVVNSANSTISRINIDNIDELEVQHKETFFVDGFWPVGIDITSSDHMIISVTGSNEIHILNKDGSFIRKIGTEGHLPGQLNAPQGLWVNQEDHIYVAETYNGRIQKFDMLGRLLWASELQWPGLTFICKGPDNLLFATDCLHNLVLFFEIDSLEKNETHPNVIELQIGNHKIHL